MLTGEPVSCGTLSTTFITDMVACQRKSKFLSFPIPSPPRLKTTDGHSAQDRCHDVGILLNPGQTLVEPSMFDGEALMVDPQ